jgi:hypothetical protein
LLAGPPVLELRVLAVDQQWHLVVDRNPHWVGEDPDVAGPAAVADPAEGLREEGAIDAGVRGELDVVHPELLHVVDVGPPDLGVGAGRPGHGQRAIAELEDLHHLEGRVLAA